MSFSITNTGINEDPKYLLDFQCTLLASKFILEKYAEASPEKREQLFSYQELLETVSSIQKAIARRRFFSQKEYILYQEIMAEYRKEESPFFPTQQEPPLASAPPLPTEFFVADEEGPSSESFIPKIPVAPWSIGSDVQETCSYLSSLMHASTVGKRLFARNAIKGNFYETLFRVTQENIQQIVTGTPLSLRNFHFILTFVSKCKESESQLLPPFQLDYAPQPRRALSAEPYFSEFPPPKKEPLAMEDVIFDMPKPADSPYISDDDMPKRDQLRNKRKKEEEDEAIEHPATKRQRQEDSDEEMAEQPIELDESAEAMLDALARFHIGPNQYQRPTVRIPAYIKESSFL